MAKIKFHLFAIICLTLLLFSLSVPAAVATETAQGSKNSNYKKVVSHSIAFECNGNRCQQSLEGQRREKESDRSQSKTIRDFMGFFTILMSTGGATG